MKRVTRLTLVTFLPLLLLLPRPTAQGLAQERPRSSIEPGNAVMVQLVFECARFWGDCNKIQVLKPPSTQNRPWLQGTGVSPEKALQGEAVEGGVFTMEPGTFVNAKIAYVNDTNMQIRFRAIPHAINPSELQRLGLLNCMCLGETYRVAPGQGWFRVIRVGAAKDVPAGSRMKVTHLLTSDGLE